MKAGTGNFISGNICFEFSVYCLCSAARLDSLRVVPLDRLLLGHQQLYVFNFLTLILNILLEFKVLSHLIQISILSPNSLEDGW
jgi:hypothetical protein